MEKSASNRRNKAALSLRKIKWRFLLFGPLLAACLGCARPTMDVKGAALYDRRGERVVLRGVNTGIAFPADPKGEKLAEVAKTGANCVRLTFRWIYNKSDAAQVDAALTQAARHQMFAMPGLWDATGKWDQLQFCVDFWRQPEMARVLKKHEGYTMLNIANEAGDHSVSNEAYRAAYAKAISQLRVAGLHMPLVIDAAGWGREERYILENAEWLLEQDPERNLIFSWHPWDENQPAERYRRAMDEASAKGICLIVGEFAQTGVSYQQSIDFRAIMRLAQERQIGWLWWWWQGDDKHSLTTDGVFGHWANMGEEVCVTSPHGLRQTSVRPRSMQTPWLLN